MTPSLLLVAVVAGALSNDPYLDRESGVLRNLLGIRDRKELARAEADLVSRRAATRRPLTHPTYDLAQLQETHRLLFQDIFEWAGELRKSDFSKGGTDFWPFELIEGRADKIFSQLRGGPLLKSDTDTDTFLDSLAMLYLDLNHLHPFREGNGRTQRIFLNDVAMASGRVVDWGRIGRPENDAASSRAVQSLSPGPLRRLLASAVVKVADAQGWDEIAARDLGNAKSTAPTTTSSRPSRSGGHGTSSAPTPVGIGHCPLCGRQLRSPKSIARGYGPSCWRKVNR